VSLENLRLNDGIAVYHANRPGRVLLATLNSRRLPPTMMMNHPRRSRHTATTSQKIAIAPMKHHTLLGNRMPS